MDMLGKLARLGVITAAIACAACAPAPETSYTATGGDRPENRADTGRTGSTVVRADFLYAAENTSDQVYYPIEGIAGCVFSPDGTLIFSDEKRGKVYGQDTRTRRWFEFDAPNVRPYRPVDIAVDGFKVLVLDTGSAQVSRFDLTGAFLDVLVDMRQVAPVIQTSPNALAVDRDGRMVIADAAQQQVLLLDAFQNLTMRVGDPGSLADQFADASGLAFLPDGSFLVADRGNRRLALYGRMGFFEGFLGGDTDSENPFFAPLGLAVDAFGNVFVADMGRGFVHVLGGRLTRELIIGQDGSAEGDLLAPIDVAVGPGDLLAVTDRDRAAVLVYRIIYE